MTTRSPRHGASRTGAARRGGGAGRGGGAANSAPTGSARPRSTPASTRSKRCSLVRSATAAAGQGGVDQSGRRGPGRPAATDRRPAQRGEEAEDAAPLGEGAVEVEGGHIGHRRCRPSAVGGVDGRPARARLRRRTGPRPRRRPARRGCRAPAWSRPPWRRRWTGPTGPGPTGGRCAGRSGGARPARGPRPRRVSRAVPSGTTLLTRPMASASSAPTSRPVRIRSRARPWPISRGSRTVPPSMRGTPKRRQNTPKVGAGGRHPQVAPDGQLEAAGDGVALDGGDHRLGQLEPGRAHRARPVGRDPVPVAVGQRLQVGAGTERPAAPGQDGHRRRVVGVEGGRRPRGGPRRWPGPRRCAGPAGRW